MPISRYLFNMHSVLASMIIGFSITSTLGICIYKCAPVYMKINSSWQANNRSASQIIPHHLWNPKFQFWVHKNPPLQNIPSQTSRRHPYLLNLILPCFLLFRKGSRNFTPAFCVCVCVSVLSVNFGTVEWFSRNSMWAIFHYKVFQSLLRTVYCNYMEDA
jgi:hypothetical protein